MNTICEDNPEDYILEVHFEYPEKLHNLHNDYALTPEKIKIRKSCYQIMAEKLLMSATFQLVESISLHQTWARKTDIYLHYRGLKLYLYLGMMLKKLLSVSFWKISMAKSIHLLQY